MKEAEALCWHQEAILVGPDGRGVDFAAAQVAAPTDVSDPGDALRALPEFFAGLRAGQPPLVGRTERPDCSADPGGFLTLSGGTTGTPKIIRRRSASWLHSIRVMQRLL
ncbi:MAG: hypothetical protein GY947_18665, partial [Rhodobacteraceae bacterium]|nr:hypothetical protein [Paracoccaceae bacterium]